jgi:hypothetical protein
MSLGIAFKGPEGIVLAADSRVTLQAMTNTPQGLQALPCTYDNATKLLRFTNHSHIGAVTYGVGAIGLQAPRTAHSFLPEFEDHLSKANGDSRLSVEDFAKSLSEFFRKQWSEAVPGAYTGPDMIFLVGGFDAVGPYGRVFQISIPSAPDPVEQSVGNQFGITWGGQLEHTHRLLKGFDPGLPTKIQEFLKLSDEQRNALTSHLERELAVPVPYQFLPLQDCVDLSIFLIRTTMEIQNWIVGVRGVGGAIDVATITRVDGFQPVQLKAIRGQRFADKGVGRNV